MHTISKWLENNRCYTGFWIILTSIGWLLLSANIATVFLPTLPPNMEVAAKYGNSIMWLFILFLVYMSYRTNEVEAPTVVILTVGTMCLIAGAFGVPYLHSINTLLMIALAGTVAVTGGKEVSRGFDFLREEHTQKSTRINIPTEPSAPTPRPPAL